MGGGGIRFSVSCKGFRDFIERIGIEEIPFQDREGTWANTWEEEGYIETILDRFFGAAQWLLEHDKTIVNHVEK